MGRAWTVQEENIIRANFDKLGVEGIANILNDRSVSAIQQHANSMGLKKKKKSDSTSEKKRKKSDSTSEKKQKAAFGNVDKVKEPKNINSSNPISNSIKPSNPISNPIDPFKSINNITNPANSINNTNGSSNLVNNAISPALEKYNRLQRIDTRLLENNSRHLRDIVTWKKNLEDILTELEDGDSISFGQGIFEKKEYGFYCTRGVASYISRDEMYPGNVYNLRGLLSGFSSINRVLYDWNRELYVCTISFNYLDKVKQACLEEERKSGKHKGKIEGSVDEKVKEARYRVETQIDGYVEKVSRGSNFTEVFTVEGGSHHVHYRVYDAGDIYVK